MKAKLITILLPFVLLGLSFKKEPPSLLPVGENAIVRLIGFQGKGKIISHPFLIDPARPPIHSLGLVISLPMGTNVYASGDGIITKSDKNRSQRSGKHIKITHDSTYKTLYAHLDTIFVEEGQEVKKGDLIGKSGSSGMCVAPMLFFVLYKNEKPIDPEPYIKYEHLIEGVNKEND